MGKCTCALEGGAAAFTAFRAGGGVDGEPIVMKRFFGQRHDDDDDDDESDGDDPVADDASAEAGGPPPPAGKKRGRARRATSGGGEGREGRNKSTTAPVLHTYRAEGGGGVGSGGGADGGSGPDGGGSGADGGNSHDYDGGGVKDGSGADGIGGNANSSGGNGGSGDGSQYYPGKISKICGEGSDVIVYDDVEKEQGVARDSIRVVGSGGGGGLGSGGSGTLIQGMGDRIHHAGGGGHPPCSRCGGVDFICVTCTGGGGDARDAGAPSRSQDGGSLSASRPGFPSTSRASFPSASFLSASFPSASFPSASFPSASPPGLSRPPPKKGFGGDAKIAPLPFTNVKRPKKATLLIKDVLTTLHDIFEKKITSDIANERTGKTKDSFPDYLTDYFAQKYGLRKVLFRCCKPPPYFHRIFGIWQPPHFHRSSHPIPRVWGLVRETS